MEKYCQLVIGPYGSGKSTYCSSMQKQYVNQKRFVNVINLDPAVENMNYEPLADIRDLISSEDVMDSELKLGANGALMYCMKYLIENIEWLEEALEDSNYIIIDCPGQAELYTNGRYMPDLVRYLMEWGFKVCCIYLLDSTFLLDPFKFLHGVYAAQSAMVRLDMCPTLNILTKVDILSSKSRETLESYIEPSSFEFIARSMRTFPRNKKLETLVIKMAEALDGNDLVKLMILDVSDCGSVIDLMSKIDIILQYDDDHEIKEERETPFVGSKMDEEQDFEKD